MLRLLQLILTLIALMVISLTFSVKAQTVRPSYVVVLEAPEEYAQAEMEDSLFNAIAQGVIYKVNSTILDMSQPLIGDIAQRLEALADSNSHMTLIAVEYRSAASPEGPFANNARLARGRAESFERFLAKHIDLSKVQTVKKRVTTEDYEYLVWLMQQAGDPDTEFVLNTIGKYTLSQPAKIKQALRQKDNGALWARVLRDYYPKIRNTRVVLTFVAAPRKKGEPAEAEPMLVNTAGTTMLQLENTPGHIAPLGLPNIVERPHLLSVSSNLLYDVFYMPDYGMAPAVNIGVEYYPVPEGNWTLKAQFMFPYYHKWSQHKFFQIRDYHLEVRRYFNPGRLHTGMYLAAFAQATKYGIGLGPRRGWEGEGAGGSLKFGYVLPLGSGRWRLDFHIAGGAWVSRYDPYVYGNPLTGEVTGDRNEDYFYDWTGDAQDFKRRNHRMTWFGPTEIGVTLTCDILYRRIFKKGVSAIRKEVRP